MKGQRGANPGAELPPQQRDELHAEKPGLQHDDDDVNENGRDSSIPACVLGSVCYGELDALRRGR